MAVRADPDDVRSAAAAIRAARLAVQRSADTVASSVARVHAESWRGDRADEVLGEALLQMERLRAAAEEMAALTARVERYAIALDAYLAEGAHGTAIALAPDPKTTLEVARDAAGTPKAVKWEHHRALASLKKLGVDAYAVDLSVEVDRGIRGAAEVSLLEHVGPLRGGGAWRVQHGTTLGAVGIVGEATWRAGSPSVNVGVDVVLAEKRAGLERRVGNRVARVDVRAGLAFHLGVGLSSEAVAVRLPFVSVEFSLRRPESAR